MINLFNIRKSEYIKILFLNALFFLVALDYGLLRAMKNVFVLSSGGAPLIAGAKLFGVIPAMILFKYVYDTLHGHVGHNAQVYTILSYFIVFFSWFFAWYTWQRVEQSDVQVGKSVLKQLYYNWPYLLFYIHAEAYGTFVLGVVCWGIAHRVTTNEQGRRYYTTLGAGAAIATMIAGLLNFWHLNPTALLTVIITSNVLFCLVYYYFMAAIERAPEAFDLPKKSLKKKKKLGFFASIKALFTSKDAGYLALILGLVVFYSFAINVFETVYNQWTKQLGETKASIGMSKEEIKKLYTTPFVQEAMAYQLIATGIVSLMIIFFAATWVKKRGWLFTALTVPAVLAIGGFLFFGCIVPMHNPAGPGTWAQSTTHFWIMLLGIMVIVFVKSSKYVFFDSTKENTYLVLDEKSRIEGKSAVDGVGSRIGKAGGSFFTLFLSEKWGLGWAILESKIVFAALLFISIALWVTCIQKLSVQYAERSQKITKEQNVQKRASLA